jgi:cyclophilin family peptidyl-prolyl cis-trans isomerase
VNLIDSPRLDHTYTVFADVVAGLDVVDAVLEGDEIERVELIQTTARRSSR